MKKILYINVTYKNASTGRIIHDITSASNPEEVQYRVLFQVGENADQYAVQFENKIENFFRRGVHKLLGNIDCVTIPETRRLISEIKKFEPDLIHLHTLHHQCANYLMLFEFLKTYGKPIVITMHDCWIYTGGCFHYTVQGCNQFMDGCKDCPKLKSNLDCKPNKTEKHFDFKNQFYHSCPEIYFVGVSNWLCNEARKSMICDKPIYCIRNGVDITRFDNFRGLKEVKQMREKLLCGRKYLVLGVANFWGESKGLSGFSHLAKALGNKYQVVLVGGNLKTVPDSSNLTYYGMTNDTRELAYIYNAADVLVNLSIEETFGLVSAEAAACGTPIVLYDSTANSEIAELTGGKLIPVGDEKELTMQVRNVCGGDRCSYDLTALRQELSKERMAKEYWALYRSILYR